MFNQTLCRFCNVSGSATSAFKIIWEDDDLVVFHDISPAATQHLLVVPRVHIDSVKMLGMKDLGLVRAMEKAGRNALSSLGAAPETHRLGFHIPPFNSVQHLHLHAHSLPYIDEYHARKYPVRDGWFGYTKGLTWFVEISQAIQILERGRRIGVLPS